MRYRRIRRYCFTRLARRKREAFYLQPRAFKLGTWSYLRRDRDLRMWRRRAARCVHLRGSVISRDIQLLSRRKVPRKSYVVNKRRKAPQKKVTTKNLLSKKVVVRRRARRKQVRPYGALIPA